NPKFKLLFLPVYSPWHNKIEKLWHALHETITRNHQCKNMDDLLDRFLKACIKKALFLQGFFIAA
ncbi:transposase, partial [Rheinheimera sp.]|uniref:transposase n=1 Tax=Rheinheimera sp. TaxID=1869214 RepID=UPI0040475A55